MAARIEDAFRQDAGRILGAVTAYTGDLQLAEDAVQEAFVRAIAEEHAGRAPANPAAWITTAARRIAVDSIRRARTAAKALPVLAADAAPASADRIAEFAFTGDERLELILTVCHPELAEETRLALALRFVCGIPTHDVAAMLLVSEATMAARLTRAKKRLHDSEIRFQMTDARQVTARLGDALSVIALLYTTGYAAPTGTDSRRLCGDAVELARDAQRVAGDDAEACGLLALLLLTEARHPSRVDPAGELVALAEADRTLWDRALIAEGEGLATRALRGGSPRDSPGRFALQAGIAGLHAIAADWDATDWPSIVLLYDGLVAQWPSPSARLARIVARGYADGHDALGVRLELDADEALFTGPLAAQAFAVRAELGLRAGDARGAREDFRASIDRTEDAAIRRHLERRLIAAGEQHEA
ncbi:RNA polymerase sigma factor [Microbacterium sp. ASV81]|uniref:Sigma-70 family RNA polymerase sigma factor n=1 Tax=Microbacterium capsulatum TaxID=3041921 RepID=A0ABU0XBN3_9MICO|nr:sigma-70 family RNA polymerase sigma factor [Microbacterium sp. ASV81]MDQ4212516.1 sigma-70 family RNA polymerase sigma factor [Microbacterium sp. ASV81]